MVVIDGATGVDKVQPGSVEDGDLVNPSRVLQIVYAENRNMTTSTAIIPYDDTIPQNTEGTQILSATITPKSASSYLMISALVHVSQNATTQEIIGAIFRDSGADAIIASELSHYDSTLPRHILVVGRVPSLSVSATEISVRVGLSAAGTYTINGTAGSRKLGGALVSSLTIMEVM